jgi:hypothetical protein
MMLMMICLGVVLVVVGVVIRDADFIEGFPSLLPGESGLGAG